MLGDCYCASVERRAGSGEQELGSGEQGLGSREQGLFLFIFKIFDNHVVGDLLPWSSTGGFLKILEFSFRV
jgi:hypothetical protein